VSSRPLVVRWALSASLDLEEIVGYIGSDSIDAARRVVERVETRGAALATFPLRGRVVPELARHGLHQWRELILSPYRLIYRVGDDHVEIVAVIDGRRDVEDLLLERLLRGSL